MNSHFLYCWNPDYPGYPLWNVAFLNKITGLPPLFIHGIESAFRDNTIPLVRIYCEDNTDVLNKFAEAGYILKHEKGYIWEPGYLKYSSEKVEKPQISLQEVVSPEDWAAREHLFDDLEFPDGNGYTAHIWNHFEKLKVDKGIMTSYMIKHGGCCIGTLSIIKEGGFFRLKNLYIRSEFRRLGFATAVLKYFKYLILTEQLLGFGAFVVHESSGQQAYERTGMRWKVSQWECTRPIIERDGSAP